MQAVIFAAGLGTRLLPLTADRPKALVELAGKSLLQHAIEKLKRAGVTRFIINIHHFGEKVLEHLEQHNNFGVDIVISDERDELLDTGGGLKKATPLLKEGGDEPIIIYNVDIITSVDIDKLISEHKRSGAIATMVVRERTGARGLLMDNSLQLVGWTNSDTKEVKMSRDSKQCKKFGYSGVQVISTELLDGIDMDGVFSIIPQYLKLAESEYIGGYLDSSDLWMDLGRVEELERAEELIKSGVISLH